MIKLHFHADCDGIVSAYFFSNELERLGLEHKLYPSLGSSVSFHGTGNVSLDISSPTTDSGWNLSLDHHVAQRPPLLYGNPRNAGFEWPVCFLTYSLFGDRSESWVAAIGVTADWCVERVPARFWDVVREEFPGLVPSVDQKELVQDKLGEMALMVDAAVSIDRSSGALDALKALKDADGWQSFLRGEGKASTLLDRKNQMLAEVDRIFEQQMDVEDDYVLIRFQSPHRIKSIVAGRAKDEFPGRMVVVAQDEKDKVRLSFRNADGLDVLAKELTKGIGEGGGHPRASGGWVPKDEWELFKGRLEKHFD